jgi:hypothetical protein
MRALGFGLLTAPLWIVGAYADILGTAGSFEVLAGSTVTNTGTSVINGGSVGVSPGTAVVGFPPGLVTAPGTIYSAGPVPLQAEKDLTSAYNTLAALPFTTDLTGTDLGGLTLLSGVYHFDSSALLSAGDDILTLNAQGMANQVWVFQIGKTLTTASASAVDIINAGANESVFWVVGSSATLGTTTSFEGNILASASITLNTGATISCGRALAETAAVTLDTNTLGGGCSTLGGIGSGAGSGGLGGIGPNGMGGISPTPEPRDLIVPVGLCIVGLALQAIRKRAKARVAKI